MAQNTKNIPPPPDWNEVSSKKGLPPPPPDWDGRSYAQSETPASKEKPFEFKFGEPIEVKTPKAIITYNNTVSSQEPKRSVDYIKANARQAVLTDPGMKIPENRDYYYNTFKTYGLKDKDIDKLKSYSEDQFAKGQRNEELKAAINKNPNDRDNNYLLGLNQIELDQPEEAIKSFIRGLGSPKSTKEVPVAGQTQKLGVASNDDNLLYSIGYAYNKIGDKASAEDYYKQALKANPDNYSALQAMGSIAYSKGNKEEARYLFDMGVENENKEMTSQYTRYAIGESPEEIKASEYATNISKAVNALVLGTSTGDQEFDKIVGVISPTAFVSKYFQGAKEGFKSAIDKTIGDKHSEVLEKEGGLAAGTVFLSGLIDGAFASAKLLPGVAPTLAGFELGGAVLPSQLTEAVMAPASSIFGGMSDSEMKKAVLEIGDVVASIALMKGAEHGISKGLSKKLNKNEPLNQEEAGQVIKLMQEAKPEEVERATFLSRRDEIDLNINKLKDDLSKADDVGDKHDIIEEINKLQQESIKLDVEAKKREIAPLVSAASFEVERLKKSLDYIEKNPWSDASVQKSTVESLIKKIAAKEEEMQSIISKSFEAKEVPEVAEPVVEQEVAQQKETSGEQVAAVPEIESVKPAAEVFVNPPSAEPGAKVMELPEEQKQFNDFVAKKMPDKNFNAHYVRDSERADALAEHLEVSPSKKISGELELNEEYKRGGERRGHETEKYGVTYDVNVGGKVFKMSSRDFTEGYKERNLAGEKVNVELLKPTDEDLSKVHGKFKIIDDHFTFPESPTPNAKYPYILQVRNAKTREFIGNLRISDFGGVAKKMRAPGERMERLTAGKKVFKVKDRGNEYEFNKDAFGDISVKVNDVPMSRKEASKVIKNIYEKHFDYSEGRRAEDSGMPLTTNTDEVYRYIANHSENPLEVIEAYKQASEEMNESNPKLSAIYNALPKGNSVSMDSYLKGAGDKNKISSYMLNKYLSKDGKVTIDNIVEKANSELGVEEGVDGAVSHEDVVHFIENTKRSEFEKSLKASITPSMKILAGAFRTLTGFDLNEGIVNKALRKREVSVRSELKDLGEASYVMTETTMERQIKDQPSIKEKAKSLADQIRGNKIDKGLTFATVPFAPEIWNTAMETIALSVEAGGNIIHAVQKGVDYLKSTEWYKTLSKADQADAVKAVYNKFKVDQPKEVSKVEKAQDVFTKWRRAVLLSGVSTLGKLTSAATARGLITPMEEIIGKGLGSIPFVKEIAIKAPREGGFNKYAEANAFAQWFSKATFKDAWETLKTGKGELDRQYGKLGSEEQTWLDFFGNLHSALKVGAKRAEFARSIEKRTSHAIDNGLDINNHLVQMGIGADAYEDALRAIFMQDNKFVNAYQGMIDKLDQKGTKGIATAFKTLMPIVKVPTNFVAEQSSYIGGGIKAAAKIFDKSVEGLSQEEADYVMRALKKQAIGAAVIATGYFASKNIGGYYENPSEENKKKVKSGDVKIAGVTVPHLLLHNPLLDMLQLGATAHKVINHRGRTAVDAAEQSLLGVAKQIPFIDEPIRLGRAVESEKSFDYFIGELVKSILIPPDVEKVAKKMDTNYRGETIKRKPKNIIEHLEAAIPGLRKKVARK